MPPRKPVTRLVLTEEEADDLETVLVMARCELFRRHDRDLAERVLALEHRVGALIAQNVSAWDEWRRTHDPDPDH